MTEALESMGTCKCGHQAVEHWHGGLAVAPEVKDCGIRRCRCRKFRPKRAAIDAAGERKP